MYTLYELHAVSNGQKNGLDLMLWKRTREAALATGLSKPTCASSVHCVRTQRRVAPTWTPSRSAAGFGVLHTVSTLCVDYALYTIQCIAQNPNSLKALAACIRRFCTLSLYFHAFHVQQTVCTARTVSH